MSNDFGAVLHEELLWDFSFSVLEHGIITRHRVLFLSRDFTTMIILGVTTFMAE